MLILALAIAAALPADQPVCIAPDGARIRLELAVTEQEHALGLMFRDTLASDAGMLFLFKQDGVYPFWMKNTIIPLDFVWLDADGRVVDVHANVPPCHRDPCPSYAPRAGGRAVLEVNGGAAAAHGIAAGAALTFVNVPGYPVGGRAK
jgi:uncharacterized membrane protein (UPF0127 family)